jgi:hypothetical protein
MLKNALLNWRTSLIGLGPFAVGLGHVISAVGAGQMPEEADLIAIATGIIGFLAKDGSVTGMASR